MKDAAPRNSRRAIIAVMGATGTGKSTFIKHVTGDETIAIGHKPESETFDVQPYFYLDPRSGIPVMLVDSPGFDDSRDGVTDTDILEKIAAFLQQDGCQKLNGIIYMHRISDPRVGGMSRKNLRIFKELCGEDNLKNVRIVTTRWDREDIADGNRREVDLAEGAFKTLITAGAKMRRQDNGRFSANSILAELVPMRAVEVKMMKEIKEGKSLGETSAGSIINEEIRFMQRKHERDIAGLKKEMEEAVAAKDEQLKAELAEERKALEGKMVQLEKDRDRLHETHVEELRKQATELQLQKQALERQYGNQRGGVGLSGVFEGALIGAKIGGAPGALIGGAVGAMGKWFGLW